MFIHWQNNEYVHKLQAHLHKRKSDSAQETKNIELNVFNYPHREDKDLLNLIIHHLQLDYILIILGALDEIC